jgi:hypothetical protein
LSYSEIFDSLNNEYLSFIVKFGLITYFGVELALKQQNPFQKLTQELLSELLVKQLLKILILFILSICDDKKTVSILLFLCNKTNKYIILNKYII